MDTSNWASISRCDKLGPSPAIFDGLHPKIWSVPRGSLISGSSQIPASTLTTSATTEPALQLNRSPAFESCNQTATEDAREGMHTIGIHLVAEKAFFARSTQPIVAMAAMIEDDEYINGGQSIAIPHSQPANRLNIPKQSTEHWFVFRNITYHLGRDAGRKRAVPCSQFRPEKKAVGSQPRERDQSAPHSAKRGRRHSVQAIHAFSDTKPPSPHLLLLLVAAGACCQRLNHTSPPRSPSAAATFAFVASLNNNKPLRCTACIGHQRRHRVASQFCRRLGAVRHRGIL
ncbi:hypothetical protein K440DRAFT_672839 [Wilcoxina mikolae CBS 423.85]|nr:hypothetical protein K440DRAFT_672839 [Wilcoxina mikolae CBS 423.85]